MHFHIFWILFYQVLASLVQWFCFVHCSLVENSNWKGSLVNLRELTRQTRSFRKLYVFKRYEDDALSKNNGSSFIFNIMAYKSQQLRKHVVKFSICGAPRGAAAASWVYPRQRNKKKTVQPYHCINYNESNSTPAVKQWNMFTVH